MLTLAVSASAQTEPFLKSGDTVTVSVFNEPDLSVTLTIRDGKIAFPLLGQVQAEGLSPMELKQILEGRLAKYLIKPTVTVRVVTKD